MPKKTIKPKQTEETTTTTEESAGFAVGDNAPADFMRAHGLGERDISLVRQYAEALYGVYEGIMQGSEKKVREHYPALVTLTRDAERFRLVARKAITPRMEE